MIAIVNVSKEYNIEGVQLYEVRINTETVAVFEHLAEDGLSWCLKRAAEAVDEAMPEKRVVARSMKTFSDEEKEEIYRQYWDEGITQVKLALLWRTSQKFISYILRDKGKEKGYRPYEER